MGAKHTEWMARRHRSPGLHTCTVDCHTGRSRMKSETSSGSVALVAILRGVLPSRVVAIGNVLYEAGFRRIEVPLNSPDPFASITALADCRVPAFVVGHGSG